MTVQELRNKIEQLKGRRDQIQQQLEDTKKKLTADKEEQLRLEKAREIIRAVALKTEQQLQVQISDITTLALEAVYDDPYSLEVEFVQRRNKTECDLYFSRDKERVDPLSAAGGGAVNVAAFALRVASWAMQRPRSNNVLGLDEPFNNVSTDLLPRVGEMLKQVSNKLGLQIIMVTHAPELMEGADKTFVVQMRKGVTEVKED